MAFGQPSGPPAAQRDVAQLAELLDQLGYTSFREARHPFGLTQRQAAGRFTRDEAAALATRLESEVAGLADGTDGAGGAEPGGEDAAPPVRRVRAGTPQADPKVVLAGLPDAALADELALRGWTCIPPS